MQKQYFIYCRNMCFINNIINAFNKLNFCLFYGDIELPKKPPIITGGLKSYQLGDRLELNCTSPRTFPATTLQWVLNGNKVIRTL